MSSPYQDKNLSPKKRAQDLLSRMSIDEKVGQLNQKLYGFSVYERNKEVITITKEFKEEVKKYSGLGVLYGLYRADPWSGKNYENGLEGVLAPKTYNMLQRYVIEHSRLGIPMMLSSECPHGHQALDGYLLPVNLSVGATFHPDLLKQAYQICGKQLKEMGVDMALISTLDILRDPRWGRSEECYSEDPYLASEFAKAAVAGIQDNGIAAVAKHFCAQGEGTGGINASAARIGERELREIHLPAVKACVRAGVKGIMAAYNEIDGIPCHGNAKLLRGILREEMQFDGVVMADGVAIDQLNVMTGDDILSGALALKSGVTISLWDNGYSKLKEALEQKRITMEDLDEAVLRVLELKFELGLFETPYIKEDNAWTKYDYEHYPYALKLARESVVLLKNNNNCLPINPKSLTSIAVIGPNADEIYSQLGDYTPPVKKEKGVTVLKGILDFMNREGEGVEVKYSKGCDLFQGTKEGILQAVNVARSCDYVILVLGGSSSRFDGAEFDINGAALTRGTLNMDCGEGVDSGDLKLSGAQYDLFNAIRNTGKTVITVLIQGRPYATEDIIQASQGVLCAFYPGMLGGQAIAEILFGKISPSGHLPVSIPRQVGQIPVYYNYKSSYNGMNYFNIDKTPLYPFGYGLSYTKFSYSNFTVKYVSTDPLQGSNQKCSFQITGNDKKHVFQIFELTNGEIQIQFDIANVGCYDAYSVPLLYIKDTQASIIPRVCELKAFHKVWVPTNKSAQCILSLDLEKLSIWNDKMEFVLEPGEFQLFLNDGNENVWTDNIYLY